MSATSATVELSQAAAQLADPDFKMVGTRTALRALMRWCDECKAIGHDVERIYGDEGLMGVIVTQKPGYMPPLPLTCMDALVGRFAHEETPIQ